MSILSSARMWLGRSAIVAAVGLPLAVAGVLVPFRSSVPNTDAALVLVAVVVAVAAFGRRASGLIAAASAALWFDFFLTKPYERLTITHRNDIETTVLLLLVGAAVTEIAVNARRHRTIAVTDEAYLDAIRTTTDLVSANESPQLITEHVKSWLIALLGLRNCRFEQALFGGMPRLESDGTLVWGEHVWDVEHDDLPRQPVELLCLSNGRAYGRLVLEAAPGASPPLAARQVAGILAGQVGLALAGVHGRPHMAS